MARPPLLRVNVCGRWESSGIPNENTTLWSLQASTCSLTNMIKEQAMAGPVSADKRRTLVSTVDYRLLGALPPKKAERDRVRALLERRARVA